MLCFGSVIPPKFKGSTTYSESQREYARRSCASSNAVSEVMGEGVAALQFACVYHAASHLLLWRCGALAIVARASDCPRNAADAARVCERGAVGTLREE
jgi:hypothetical protein